MVSHSGPLRDKVIEFQKEIVRFKTEIVRNQSKHESDMKMIFLEQIEWLEMVDLMIMDIQTEGVSEHTSSTLKSLERLKNKIARFLAAKSINKIDTGRGPVTGDDFTIVETRPKADIQDGTVLEVIRQGYKWQSLLLRKSEVVTVKN